MGSYHEEAQVPPILEFSRECLVLKQGSEEWKGMSEKVREACEEYGCFILVQDDILPLNVQEEMLKAMQSLFDLPRETKEKHIVPKPFRSYRGNCSHSPLTESFGIDDAFHLETSQAFTNVMWPQGNPTFR